MNNDPNSQHMKALAEANKTRLARSRVKKEMRSGKSLGSVLQEKPECLESMTLVELLCAQKRWGPSRARKLLFFLAIPESKTIGTLTERQRSLLIETLEKE